MSAIPVSLPQAADIGLLPAADDEAAGGVGVVLLQGLDDVPQAQVVLEQGLGSHQHVVLLDEAAEAVDLVDSGDRLELRRHQKVLDAPQFHGRERVALQGVLEDLAQAGADRAQLRLRAHRQLLLGALEALEDLLAGEVDVGVVIEDHDHLREAGLGEGADLGDPAARRPSVARWGR